VVTYVDETPEIPKQDKVEVLFYDVFGEPMVGLDMTPEFDGKPSGTPTMSRGQVVHVTPKDNVTVKIRKDGYTFNKKKNQG
jgi:hypothetical protein